MSTQFECDPEPDWTPLQKLVGRDTAPMFMHMGRCGTLQFFKHRHTRRYLNIDSHTGLCFRKCGGCYREVPSTLAIAHVLDEAKETVWS